MKKDIVLYGAGGLARETHWMITSDSKLRDQFNIKGFIVDEKYLDSTPKSVYGTPVYAKNFLINANRGRPIGVIICIGDTYGRKHVYENLSKFENISFPSLIYPTCRISPDAVIGEGAMIHSNCTITVNAKIGKCVFMNGNVTVGHDAVIEDFVSIYPRCDISGHVKIGGCTSIGTQSFILERKNVGENSVVVPGSIVLRNVPSNVTVMGNPAKVYMKHTI
ncbi:acetyltransferase [Synergistes jonesii]|uniref:acetyltransferase n=1 Tax=Synergistes jonesii TaxID=2754 RepID=UPI00242B79BE|nr:acetyltransferase [Synergistes jonesii]